MMPVNGNSNTSSNIAGTAATSPVQQQQ